MNTTTESNKKTSPAQETNAAGTSSVIREIGQLLIKTRKEKRLSLETVHKNTFVSLRYLKALEEGDGDQFPAEVYYTGSLHRYAQYLGIDDNALVQKYTDSVNAARKAFPEAKKKKNHNPLLLILVAAAFIGILFAAAVVVRQRAFVSNESEAVPAPAPATPETPAPETPAPETPSPATPQPPAPVAPKATPLKPTVPGPLKLSIQWKDTSWVRVTADNALVFEGTLPAGTQREWTAHNGFRMKTGYAPGITVQLNDKNIDIIKGAQQDVNELDITPESIRE